MYPDITIDNKSICDICNFAKHRKLPYSSSTSIASSNFELLHFDIWGPIAKVSIYGHRYFLTIVDDHSRFLWTILLKTKSEVPSRIENFIHLIQNQHNVTPKIIRSDNGLEFLLSDFYASQSIIHQKSCVETPQQNGRVERKHQHILKFVRALLFQSKLPHFFWSYDVLHVVFVINRVPTPIFKPITLSCFVWCLTWYQFIQSLWLFMLCSQELESLFSWVTYKGFVLYDIDTKEIFISRNVTFHESVLPYISPTPHSTSNWGQKMCAPSLIKLVLMRYVFLILVFSVSKRSHRSAKIWWYIRHVLKIYILLRFLFINTSWYLVRIMSYKISRIWYVWYLLILTC